MKNFIIMGFFLSFIFFCILFIYGVVNLPLLFFMAKKNEKEFFQKNLILGYSQFSQFWKLIRQGKVSELKNEHLKNKIRRLQRVKKIYFFVFGIMVFFLMWIFISH